MPKIVFLPHKDLCPDGAVLEAIQGETILDVALRHGIDIEHACEKILRLYYLSLRGARRVRFTARKQRVGR